MTALLFAGAAFVATMLGGAVALRLRDRLHLILGFSAGAVVAVAFFDLLPHAIELTAPHYAPETVTAVVALGFLLYLLLDRLLLLGHAHAEGEHDHGGHDPGEHARGTIRAGSISLHSLLDGLGLGFAFQVSPAVGMVVGLAILAHDFSDGINTVNVIVAPRRRPQQRAALAAARRRRPGGRRARHLPARRRRRTRSASSWRCSAASSSTSAPPT